MIGLVAALSRLTDGDEEYLILTLEGEDGWIRPHVSGPCRIVAVPVESPSRRTRRLLRSAYNLLRRLPVAGAALEAQRERRRLIRLATPASDGTVERLGVDVMHFTFQAAFVTAVPSIYHPHDLQHLHLPDLFDKSSRWVRERQYRAFCKQARIVAVASEWIKADIERAYDIPSDRIRVLPLAPASLEAPPTSSESSPLLERANLPERFVLYPAQTWPHKNHAGLLRASALLRKAGVEVDLVFTGRLTPYHDELLALQRELDLDGHVTWLGFVGLPELRALYEKCVAVVVPTLFEAGSFPVLEAFAIGAAVACSNVTSLPQQVGDAGLLFDPHDPAAMAEAVRALWLDEDLRGRLVARGHERVSGLTWDRVAMSFRDLYREVAANDPSAPRRIQGVR